MLQFVLHSAFPLEAPCLRPVWDVASPSRSLALVSHPAFSALCLGHPGTLFLMDKGKVMLHTTCVAHARLQWSAEPAPCPLRLPPHSAPGSGTWKASVPPMHSDGWGSSLGIKHTNKVKAQSLTTLASSKCTMATREEGLGEAAPEEHSVPSAASLLPTHQRDFCPGLRCSRNRHVARPNVCPSPF